MKNILISVILIILLSFRHFAIAQNLDTDVRAKWDGNLNTVGEVTTYLIEPFGYRLLLETPLSRDIARLNVTETASERVLPVKDILLDIVPYQFFIVIDETNKYISFTDRPYYE